MVEPAAVVTSWRIRDVALDLLAPRQEIVPPTDDSNMPTVSSQFDVDTCLARLRRDKASVVRNSFEAAASCILESLSKTADEDGDLESINEDDLPRELDDIPALENIRNASMLRAHDNKDPSKRKNVDSAGSVRSRGKSPQKTESTPKFTRNTPASSAAALDSRLTSSRAILCTAANVAFSLLAPPLPGLNVDMADIPQNPINADSKGSVSNMGAVVVEAQTLGKRIAAVAANAARRAARRSQHRKDNIRYDSGKQSPTSILQVSNPFAWRDFSDSDDTTVPNEENHVYDPDESAVTSAWSEICLPRLIKILHSGVGHAIYHDTEWRTRHGRIADLFRELACKDDNFGPHLIITVEPEVSRFAKEFRGINSHLRLMSSVDTKLLRAMKYTGGSERKGRLRKQFAEASGMDGAPFHVIITTYSDFLTDYLHFCQLPFESVIVDDGLSLLAAAQSDGNSQLTTMWESGFFSRSDHQMGLAGVALKDWNFASENIETSMMKDACIGITARHRILTTCTSSPGRPDSLPISGLVNFILPHFADSVREEWDRSKISNDSASMKHFQKLLTHSVAVHSPQSGQKDMYTLATQSLMGKLPFCERMPDPVPAVVPDDVFVNDGKVAQSRRSALLWLGKADESWLRYELGTTSFQPMLNAMKASAVHGHLCEEIVTASSTTTTGATGQVAGTLAYRPAVRCCRHFGSEQGLRQHLSAVHAPPGTWLCRTCGSDCVTSQARTHHERTCGQPNAAAEGGDTSGPSRTTATKPGKPHGPAGVVGKKKGPKTLQPPAEEQDPDGSIRVPGYRGVWVNQAGKHFVKIDGQRLKNEKGKEMLFPAVEDAAKKHDQVIKNANPQGKVEYNFKPDGTRIVYEDVATSSNTGIGGGAANVVPLLSVINIKDLPPDVKPLLRDPRQTSRTGGNSKRHIYAYRGVCRQTRKGHDRWQSQISFMGVNHYLGTYDSEWDAASVYAWAHKLLYGVEATLQAQKEGEEAAAAYEKEKKDIAAGVVAVGAPPKVEKKKNKPGRKARESDTSLEISKKRGPKDDGGGPMKKRPKTVLDKESLVPILTKSTSRAVALAPRNAFAESTDMELAGAMAKRLVAVRGLHYVITDVPAPAPVVSDFRPCIPISSLPTRITGCAMLLGLSPSLFGWTRETCLSRRDFDSRDDSKKAEEALDKEFGPQGDNGTFKTLIQGTLSIIGCASFRTQRVYTAFSAGSPPVGGAVGSIDCHIGGSPKACSESAAAIRYLPTSTSGFQFSALSKDDVVTMNGKLITPEMGGFPLFNEDVCTVGPRVFVFLLPSDV